MTGTLGRYRLIAELGRGGMGTVYLAVVRGPARFSKLVVVKQLRPDFAGDAGFTAMFLEEARLAARLHHPNIVQTNEVVCDPEQGHFIVMEYLEGASLKRVIRRLRARGDEFARRIYARAILDVLTALQYAHTLKDFDGTPLRIVHRDVNPDNVLVLQTGEVKLLDFGIAKAADSAQETRVGMLKGKLHYMSPEQMAGDDVDCRADVFAVGTMLWDALVGRRLWEGMKGIDIMTALAKGTIPTPRSVNPGVPEALERICVRALAVRPADRYPDAGALRVDLERALGSDAMATADLAATMSAEYLEEHTRMRRLVAEQLQALDQVPDAEIVNLGRQTLAPDAPGTAVIGRSLQVRELSLAPRTTAPAEPESVPDFRRGPSLRKRAAAALGVLALVGGVTWALRSHVIVVNPSLLGRSRSGVDVAPSAFPAPSPPASAATALERPSPPPAVPASPAERVSASSTPPLPAATPDPRPLTRARRSTRREVGPPNPPPMAARNAMPADRAGGPSPGPAISEAGIQGAAVASSPPEAAPVASLFSAPPPVVPVVPAPAAASPPARGAIPQEAVRAVVRSHSADIQRCFDRAQMDRPDLKARVDMAATVGPSGRVDAVSTSSDHDGTSRLQSCIQSAVRGWPFPEPAGGSDGHIRYTFVFE